MRHDVTGGKARWKPSEVGLEVYTTLSLLEVGALSEVSVHEEAGFVVEVEGVSFEPRTFSYCEVRFNCWEWMLRSDSGFMLPRTEVLACLMIGPAIRHCKQCRMPVPPIRPKELRPLRGQELMDCRLPHIVTVLCTFGWRCCTGLDG